MQTNNHFEKLEEKAKSREEKKRKEKEMKVSGKSLFEVQKLMKERNEPDKS